MKKIITFLIIILCLTTCVSCSNSHRIGEHHSEQTEHASENSKASENKEVSKTSDEQLTQESSNPSDYHHTEENQERVKSHEVQQEEIPNLRVDETGEPLESDSRVGMIYPPSGSVAENFVGTWTLVEGMPEDLSSYILTVKANGEATAEAIDKNGYGSITSAQFTDSEFGPLLIGKDDIVIVSFKSKDGTLITRDLSDSEAVFRKS